MMPVNEQKINKGVTLINEQARPDSVQVLSRVTVIQFPKAYLILQHAEPIRITPTVWGTSISKLKKFVTTYLI